MIDSSGTNFGAAGWGNLAAAPTFAAMALITPVFVVTGRNGSDV
jgi:hypothetical protein